MPLRSSGGLAALALLVGNAACAQRADSSPPAEAPPGNEAYAAPNRASISPRYDEVGYASWYGEEMGNAKTASGKPFDPGAITAAHRSLPLGSFVEVTALDSGKTILVLVNDRGPGRPDRLIDLSRGAAQLLGTSVRALSPVRVRLVDPPASDKAALNAGKAGSARLDSPPVLLSALRKRLPPSPSVGGSPAESASAAVVASATSPGVTPAPGAGYARPGTATSLPSPLPASKAAATASSASSPLAGPLFVQVAALSSEARARALARAMGASVKQLGRLYRVRLGPFRNHAAAVMARDGAVRRGYGDARITTE